jgi:Zn-dependent peptidase ImmA (M78 family)
LQKVIEYLQTEYSLDVTKVNFGNTVSGLMVRITDLDHEHTSIGFNANEPWCRRRFTIAHEIGHLLMGHTCEFGANDNKEKEADCFAAELLIPKSLLKTDFLKNKNVPALSDMYKVSQQAMSIKIMDDRLLK